MEKNYFSNWDGKEKEEVLSIEELQKKVEEWENSNDYQEKLRPYIWRNDQSFGTEHYIMIDARDGEIFHYEKRQGSGDLDENYYLPLYCITEQNIEDFDFLDEDRKIATKNKKEIEEYIAKFNLDIEIEDIEKNEDGEYEIEYSDWDCSRGDFVNFWAEKINIDTWQERIKNTEDNFFLDSDYYTPENDWETEYYDRLETETETE